MIKCNISLTVRWTVKYIHDKIFVDNESNKVHIDRIFFAFAAFQVNRLAIENCFATLDDATTQVTTDIINLIEDDREQLKNIADLLVQHDLQDSDIIKHHLSALRQRGTLSGFGLLLPDHRLILGTGKEIELGNDFDYNEEIEKLPYTSDIVEALEDGDEKGFYQAVPMEKDGQTIGILYGFVSLPDFADSISVTAFDGKVQIFVADGSTGDFMVDTWHDKLGNIFDGDILTRKVKKDMISMK